MIVLSALLAYAVGAALLFAWRCLGARDRMAAKLLLAETAARDALARWADAKTEANFWRASAERKEAVRIWNATEKRADRAN